MTTILGIETSCDETAAAVVRDGRQVLSNVISSQVDLHKQYGGVVPELASRAHLDAVIPIIDLALSRAGVRLHALDAIAVTRGPGLIGALMVGVQVGKGLAIATKCPIVGVHHVAAHIYAPHLTDERTPEAPALPYPHVALAVSGGHTALYLVHGPRQLTPLGSTLDDAAGEAFDKVALMLGLGYPGGRRIDELAQTGRGDAIAFPRAWLGARKFDFSFSGLKTAVRTHVRTHGAPAPEALPDLLASFQDAVAHVLVSKTLAAAKAHRVRHVVIAGGVAANSRLRSWLAADAAKAGVTAHLTPLRYCSDNAAMIAGLGYHLLVAGEIADPHTLDPSAELSPSPTPAGEV